MDTPKHHSRIAPSTAEKGIGLYTNDQEKTTTPFQYFVQIVVGFIVSLLGACLLYQTVTVRQEEIRKYGSADAHAWEWVVGFSVLAIGVFWVMPG